MTIRKMTLQFLEADWTSECKSSPTDEAIWSVNAEKLFYENDFYEFCAIRFETNSFREAPDSSLRPVTDFDTKQPNPMADGGLYDRCWLVLSILQSTEEQSCALVPLLPQAVDYSNSTHDEHRFLCKNANLDL